jgi:hypothetical protein
MLTLEILPGSFALVHLPGDAAVPMWLAGARRFSSSTRTPGELSLLVDAEVVPDGLAVRSDYRGLRVAGSLPLESVGIIAGLSGALAAAGIPLLAIATHDTDYLFVAGSDLERAREALEGAGHSFVSSNVT